MRVHKAEISQSLRARSDIGISASVYNVRIFTAILSRGFNLVRAQGEFGSEDDCKTSGEGRRG